jgi:hypothetical protein
MEFTVSMVFNATAELQAANNYPNIRVTSVGELYYSSTVNFTTHLSSPY